MLIIKKPAVPADVRYEVNRLKVIEQQSNDMTAHENIPAGRYFTIGTRVFHALKVIVKGETLQPGKNCEEISMAEALNKLNESEE